MRKDRKPARGDIGPGGGARILEFKRSQPDGKRRPSPIRDPIRRIEDDEDRRRMRQNLGAFLIVVALLTSGFWLVDQLRISSRIANCLEAGHHNCLPLDVSTMKER